ncbi:hypothetical protein ONS96_010967 [Cadophora gregata f. sp. sojae]|nr:hypothetical protein ONS96_010967 [Cadophora gregata f. sp. sojae]
MPQANAPMAPLLSSPLLHNPSRANHASPPSGRGKSSKRVEDELSLSALGHYYSPPRAVTFPIFAFLLLFGFVSQGEKKTCISIPMLQICMFLFRHQASFIIRQFDGCWRGLSFLSQTVTRLSYSR